MQNTALILALNVVILLVALTLPGRRSHLTCPALFLPLISSGGSTGWLRRRGG